MRPCLKDNIVSHAGVGRIDWVVSGGFEYLHADNVTAGAAVGSGPTFASDDIGGVQYPRAKVVWGADGAANDTSAAAPLPVVQTGTPALPTGAATAAKQDTEIASLATLAGAVAGTEMQVDVLSSALPTGAATEATLAAASAKLPAALGQAAMAASMSVVIANNQSNIPTSDGGTSHTVDCPQIPAALGQTTAAESMSVVLASDQGVVSINDGGNSITTDFVGQKTTDMDTGAGTDTVLGVGILLPASGGSVQGGTATNPIRTDPTGTTTQPVSLASVPSHAVTNAGTFAVQAGQAAHDAAVSGNPVRAAGRAGNADYTAVANGDTADFLTDLNGKQIVLPYAIPENMVSGATAAITGTSDTSVIASPGAGIRNYITQILVINSHATVGTVVEIKSATTVLYRGYAAPVGGGFSLSFPVPLRCAANEALNAANITTGSNVYVSASGYKAP